MVWRLIEGGILFLGKDTVFIGHSTTLSNPNILPSLPSSVGYATRIYSPSG